MPFNIGATSAVKDDLRAGFISAEMSDDLSIVPGIGQGKANKAALEHAGIFTPYQLLGQFLLLKAPGMVRAPARGGARACTRVRTSEQRANAHASALALSARSLLLSPSPSLSSPTSARAELAAAPGCGLRVAQRDWHQGPAVLDLPLPGREGQVDDEQHLQRGRAGSVK